MSTVLEDSKAFFFLLPPPGTVLLNLITISPLIMDKLKRLVTALTFVTPDNGLYTFIHTQLEKGLFMPLEVTFVTILKLQTFVIYD